MYDFYMGNNLEFNFIIFTQSMRVIFHFYTKTVMSFTSLQGKNNSWFEILHNFL